MSPCTCPGYIADMCANWIRYILQHKCSSRCTSDPKERWSDMDIGGRRCRLTGSSTFRLHTSCTHPNHLLACTFLLNRACTDLRRGLCILASILRMVLRLDRHIQDYRYNYVCSDSLWVKSCLSGIEYMLSLPCHCNFRLHKVYTERFRLYSCSNHSNMLSTLDHFVQTSPCDKDMPSVACFPEQRWNGWDNSTSNCQK